MEGVGVRHRGHSSALHCSGELEDCCGGEGGERRSMSVCAGGRRISWRGRMQALCRFRHDAAFCHAETRLTATFPSVSHGSTYMLGQLSSVAHTHIKGGQAYRFTTSAALLALFHLSLSINLNLCTMFEIVENQSSSPRTIHRARSFPPFRPRVCPFPPHHPPRPPFTIILPLLPCTSSSTSRRCSP